MLGIVTIRILLNVLQYLSLLRFAFLDYYLLFMVIDLIILYSYHIVMTDIYICILGLLCILWTTKLFTNIILHCLHICLPVKFPDALKIRTRNLALHNPTLYQDTSGRWLIPYDLVFINRQIYSFRHNRNNLIKYFSLMESCI